MLDRSQRSNLVARLEVARRTRKPAQLPCAEYPDLTLDDAYAVQHEWAERRAESEGRRPVGYKVALTTKGMQRAFGSGEPVYGVLLDDMLFDATDPVPFDRFVAPRVEMELAFRLRTELRAPCTEEDAIAAIDWVAPAIEILDSRTVLQDAESGRTRSALDIVADAGGAAGFVVSDTRIHPREVDLSRIAAVLYHNGEAEDSGVFPLVFGRPERSLVWLATALAQSGAAIQAGDTVLSGSVIKPYPVARGERFDFDFADLGTITLQFE